MNMQTPVSHIDRLADALFRAAAVLPLLLLLALAVGLVLARPARADEIVCTGQNLMEELAARDPALLEKVRREADATPNGRGLLWKVEKEGAAPSYLFGTMHMADPRVTELPEAAKTALEGAHSVVIETTDVLDERAMAGALLQNPELSMFVGKESLGDYLSEEERQLVDEALSKMGISFTSIQKMKPWMLISLIALPQCELERKAAGMAILDLKLAREATADGKELLGLETAVEQFSAMASLPMSLHTRGLVQTVKLGNHIEDVMETMIDLYAQGETGMFWPLIRVVLPGGEKDAEDYAAFDQALVRARNGVMAERARPILDKGDAFIAVGALHLPGDEGLIELLRRAGYTVTRAD